MSEEEYFIYDMYLIQPSGLPIFSGCTGSDYCKTHSDQHALHTGFFSAIRSFAGEAFQETDLEGLRFDSIQINFKGDVSSGIYLALVHPKFVPLDAIQTQMDRALEIYLGRYHSHVSSVTALPDRYTEEFKADLIKLGIIRTPKLANLNPMQITKTSSKWGQLFSGFFKVKKK